MGLFYVYIWYWCVVRVRVCTREDMTDRIGGKFGRVVGMRGLLPPGFRFEPTEEELVFEYLKCKVLCRALPASIIPEINNICNYDPWDVPGGEEAERYLFSKKVVGKSSSSTRTPSGYWKEKGHERKILSSSSSNNNSVGMKKTLSFYTNRGCGTGWMMHEYRLISNDQQPPQCPCDPEYLWILCRIFFKKHHHYDHQQLHNSESDSGSVSSSSSSTT